MGAPMARQVATMPSKTQARCSLGAAGEEHVEAWLGDVLKLAFGGRVVDRDVRIGGEAGKRFAMLVVVANGLGKGGAPLVEVIEDGCLRRRYIFGAATSYIFGAATSGSLIFVLDEPERSRLGASCANETRRRDAGE